MTDSTRFMTAVFDTTQADGHPDSSYYSSVSALNGSEVVNPYETNRRPAFDAIDRFVTPVWYLLGIPGNIVAYVVWIQRRMRPSSGCYLAALALDECVFLILQVFFELQMRWNITLIQLPGLCELFPVVFLSCQHLSPLLVLGFTTERYISVCHPFQRERFCTTRRALLSIAGLVAFALVLNSVQAYFWHYVPPVDGGSGSGLCDLRQEVTSNGSGSLWSVYSWITEMLVFGLVPSAILVLNVFVIRETRRLAASEMVLIQQQQHVSRDRGASRTVSTGSNIPSATTVMLLAVSFYLIVTTLPVTILYVLYLSFPEGDPTLTGLDKAGDPTWKRHFAYNEIRTVVEEIGLSHYACNFYIYLLTGRIFRRELQRLLTTIFCPNFHRRGDVSGTETERTVIRIRTDNNKGSCVSRGFNNGSAAML